MKVELFVFHYFVQVLEGYESSRDDADYGGDLYPKLYISQVIKIMKRLKSSKFSKSIQNIYLHPKN